MSDWFNQYRFFPRLAYGVFLLLLWESGFWFMELKEPSTAQSNFVIAMGAAAAAFFKFYVESGPSAKPNESN